MPNTIHSTKSGSNWTLDDLESYHISLHEADPLQFFGLQELPQPVVDRELLTVLDGDTMQKSCNAELMVLLDFTMIPDEGGTAIVDFTVKLLNILGYAPRKRVPRTRVELPLSICGEISLVQTDVCIVSLPQKDILLLVQGDGSMDQSEPANAQAELVAEAIAAFNENNEGRKVAGLPPLADKVMPGILMVGTSPTFFKIPVTKTLSDHIANGTYPLVETQVTYCYPPVPRPAHRCAEGIKPLDNRRETLKCFEAFKTIVGI